MSTVVSLICLGPSFQKMTNHFLLHGSLWPTNLEKNLKPSIIYLWVVEDFIEIIMQMGSSIAVSINQVTKVVLVVQIHKSVLKNKQTEGY